LKDLIIAFILVILILSGLWLVLDFMDNEARKIREARFKMTCEELKELYERFGYERTLQIMILKNCEVE